MYFSWFDVKVDLAVIFEHNLCCIDNTCLEKSPLNNEGAICAKMMRRRRDKINSPLHFMLVVLLKLLKS